MTVAEGLGQHSQGSWGSKMGKLGADSLCAFGLAAPLWASAASPDKGQREAVVTEFPDSQRLKPGDREFVSSPLSPKLRRSPARSRPQAWNVLPETTPEWP